VKGRISAPLLSAENPGIDSDAGDLPRVWAGAADAVAQVAAGSETEASLGDESEAHGNVDIEDLRERATVSREETGGNDDIDGHERKSDSDGTIEGGDWKTSTSISEESQASRESDGNDDRPANHHPRLWARLISPPRQRHGHAILDLCCAGEERTGHTERRTISKGLGGEPGSRERYRQARKAKWGSRWHWDVG
jgi:hypothetical protein